MDQDQAVDTGRSLAESSTNCLIAVIVPKDCATAIVYVQASSTIWFLKKKNLEKSKFKSNVLFSFKKMFSTSVNFSLMDEF